MRECCRQVQVEVVSKSRNKSHQTWGPPISGALYKVCNAIIPELRKSPCWRPLAAGRGHATLCPLFWGVLCMRKFRVSVLPSYLVRINRIGSPLDRKLSLNGTHSEYHERDRRRKENPLDSKYKRGPLNKAPSDNRIWRKRAIMGPFTSTMYANPTFLFSHLISFGLLQGNSSLVLVTPKHEIGFTWGGKT